MSEYDSLIDGYEGAPSSEGERRVDNAEVAGSTPAGPTPPEFVNSKEALGAMEPKPLISVMESAFAGKDELDSDEPPHEDDDWPEPEPAIPLYPTDDLRALKPDQRPLRGKHYVIFDGKPMPVVRDNLTATEDEFVRSQISPVDDLKDPDGNRKVRADRALRLRYRGYVCGQMSSL